MTDLKTDTHFVHPDQIVNIQHFENLSLFTFEPVLY